MSEARTPVDRTETEAWESERNRVAWNLPRGRPAPSKPTDETANQSRQLTDAKDQVATDGGHRQQTQAKAAQERTLRERRARTFEKRRLAAAERKERVTTARRPMPDDPPATS